MTIIRAFLVLLPLMFVIFFSVMAGVKYSDVIIPQLLANTSEEESKQIADSEVSTVGRTLPSPKDFLSFFIPNSYKEQLQLTPLDEKLINTLNFQFKTTVKNAQDAVAQQCQDLVKLMEDIEYCHSTVE